MPYLGSHCVATALVLSRSLPSVLLHPRICSEMEEEESVKHTRERLCF